MLPTKSLAFLALTLAVSTVEARPRHINDDEPDDTPLPIVIWHGLGDTFNGEGLKQVGELADAIHPGTFVYTVSLGGTDASADRSATFFGNVTAQLDEVCEALAAHPILSTAPAIDAVGFSQGGHQHNGIVDFAACGAYDWLCKGAMSLLRYNTFSTFVQSRLVPAQYFRDPKDYAAYLDGSNFLADINNEREVKNKTYAENLARLSNFVMYLFEDDTTVIPRETSWFQEVNGTEVIAIRDRPIYKEDWIGLKALDKKGGLRFRSITGDHMQIPESVLNETFANFFGPYYRKFEPETGVDDGRWGEL
ncbi:hypothetical protein V2G26_005410 [Clonostachys chloroleuca]